MRQVLYKKSRSFKTVDEEFSINSSNIRNMTAASSGSWYQNIEKKIKDFEDVIYTFNLSEK